MNDFLNRERARRRAQAAVSKSIPIEFKQEHMAAIQTLARSIGSSPSNALAIMLEAALTAARFSYYTDLMNAAFVKTPEEIEKDVRENEEGAVEDGQIQRPPCAVCTHEVHAAIAEGVPVPMMCREPGCGCVAGLTEQIHPPSGESMQPDPGEDPEAFRARLQALARGETKEGEPS
jgi:hypothetical protein